ncbi:CHAT domain-containing protein [Nemania diffusa]|nr:CHAT domain-containing protein [Nemania diffusa]
MNDGFALSDALSLLEIEDALDRIKREPQGHANWTEGYLWILKYRKTMVVDDIDKAVIISKAALQEIDANATSKNWRIFDCMSNAHYDKSMRTGLLDDINIAIKYCLLTMGIEGLTSQQWWNQALKLAAYMLQRSELFLTAEHTLELISHHRKYSGMEGLCPSRRARFLANFSLSYIRHYVVTGDSHSLDESLRLGYESIDARNIPDPKKTINEFTNFAATLFTSFQHTRRFSDLETALQISQFGIDHERRADIFHDAGKLVTRGSMLVTKYERYRIGKPELAEEALDEAIKLGRDAVVILKPVNSSSESVGIHKKITLLNSVAPWFATKMMLTKTPDGGKEGTTILHEALELGQGDHLERPRTLTHLSHISDVQHQILKAQNDIKAALANLEEALKYGIEAIEATNERDSYRGERLMNVGKMLLRKYLLTGAEEPSVASEKYFRMVARLDSAPILFRIPAAIQAALDFLNYSEPLEAHQLLQESISLLPSLNMGMLSPDDLRATLAQISGLSSLATSVALEVNKPPYEALMTLEVSRCIISGLFMSSKSDTTQLRLRDEKLAEEYETIRRSLVEARMVNSSNEHWRDQARIQQKILLQTLAAKEAEIRALDGFEFFQLPPSQQQLQDMAKDGPIIAINASRLRSDAIIITSKGIKSVKLVKLKYEDLEENAAVFEGLGNHFRRNASVRAPKEGPKGQQALLWLWNVVVRPILEVTELTPSRRVWWITSGLLGQAPLHAAGNHAGGSTENTLSRVVSTYISSIKALRYGRESALPISAGRKKTMLLVTMENNPWPHHNLVTVHEETVIKNVFGRGADVVHLSHPEPEVVLKNIPLHPFVHFACHGCSISSDPSQSGLLLVRGGQAAMLTIADLENINTQPGAVTYLSACSTAGVQVDGKLADEAIHLANIFQSLGFQHVIGTMWGADDSAAGEVAKRFYEKLTGGGELSSLGAAQSLHEALVDYKQATVGAEAENFLDWAPFIHVGV